MRKLGFLLPLLVIVAFACAPKKQPVVEIPQIQLDAQAAIQAAKVSINEAKEIGADVSKAEGLLSEAQTAFDNENYELALAKAKDAKAEAEAAKQRFLAAQEEAKRLAEEAEKKAAEEAIVGKEEVVKEEKPKTYTVGTWEKDRDCLWNIAGRTYIYGDPWKWKRIYQSNKEQIKDPDLIYPGQVFVIP